MRALSDDVHLLGDTLGLVIRAHGGEALFEHVERMRLAAKAARENDDDEARETLATEASSLEPEMALDVARAFTLYFQLVNLAEDNHRTRELRRREIEEGPEAISESLHQVVAGMRDAGATKAQVLEALDDLVLRFVFTAHPTEARRRTTERLLADVRGVLEDLERRVLSPTDHKIRERRLRAAIEALWEHSAERNERPEVLEEVKAGLWYLRNVLLDAVPRLHRRLCNALCAAFGDEVDPIAIPMPVAFGSWMGSDRDGNPYVTDAITERMLELHRWIVLERYLQDLDALVDPLAATAHRLPYHEPLERALQRAAEALPEIRHIADRRNPNEPLRRLLTYMRERVERARAYSAGGYAHPEDLLDDLLVIRDALRNAHAVALPDDALLDLITRVRCFGFTLATLDVREDSRVHRDVLAELLGEPEYASWAPTARLEALSHLTLPGRHDPISPGARRLLSCFEMIGRVQSRFGPEAASTYIISMTDSAADVLEVLQLAELHGLRHRIDIVPLLETPDALARGSEILGALLEDPDYRAHLRRRGDVQELLVGYSDSMKQGGILASRVRVLEAQRAVAEVCEAHGVKLRVFHGRGGSVSRGGGPTFRAIRAMPRDAFSGDMKITEQGEVRAFHFANPDLAIRYLEQTVGAALFVRHDARTGGGADLPSPGKPSWAVMDTLARESQRAYRSLVDAEGLVTFFTRATPFPQISRLNIASRPAKRRGGDAPGLADLRAIPWVFAWSQSRHVITGWYGVGAALEHVAATAEGRAALETMERTSPFFRDLLDNVQMTLAKADLPIAGRYAELCADAEVRDRIHGMIQAEYTRTRRMVLEIEKQTELLEDDPVVGRSILLRNPYVDPLSYLQLEALRRSARGPNDAWDRVARVAIQGIAAGLRNTG